MICSLIKWLISGAMDSSRPLPPFAGRHIERCKSCRDFLADSRMLDQCLERDAVLLESRPCYAAERVPATYSFRLAALTACVLFVSGYLAFHPLNTTTGDDYVRAGSIPFKPHVSELIGMGDTFTQTLTDKAEAGLNGEIQSIAKDAKSAATFLSEALAFDVPMF